MTTNGVIQGLWIGSHLSMMEQMSLRSFLTHGHEYHLYTYEAVAGVPRGIVLRNAAEILPVLAVLRKRGNLDRGRGPCSGGLKAMTVTAAICG